MGMHSYLTGFVAALLAICGQAAPFAYIGNASLAKVSVIDTASNSVVAEVKLPEPGVTGLAASADGRRVYAANGHHLFVIDAVTNVVIASHVVGSGIGGYSGVAISPNGSRVYVTTNWNQFPRSLYVLDTRTNLWIANVFAGDTPVSVAVNPAGTRIYVVNMFSNDITVIDAESHGIVGTIDLTIGSPCGRFVIPFGIAIDAAGNKAYVANQNCMSSAGYWYATVVNLRSNAIDSHVAIGTNPSGRGVALSPDGARVYVSNGAVIDTATLKMVASFQGTSLNGLAVSPDGERLYLPVIGYPSNGSVLVIDTTTYGVVASVSVGGNAMAFGQFIGPALVTPPAATPDLNQHGLTGSWYEPATSGQGVELEVYPDLSAPGIGLVFLSWFTYDSVAGGADRQRWYTAEGLVWTGQPSATLTIYQNIGGNFNAPPITAADQVGTAWLSFDSCTTGALSYNFSDGTGRTGNIPLSRLTQSVTCSTTSARPTNADFGFSGNWYDPATSGQGITVEVNPGSKALFLAWYTYAPNAAGAGPAGQRWYTAEQTTALMPGARTISVQFFETTGGAFDTPTSPAPSTVVVGSGTIAFESCTSATLSYNFTGGSSSGASGTIALRRLGPVPAGCAM